ADVHQLPADDDLGGVELQVERQCRRLWGAVLALLRLSRLPAVGVVGSADPQGTRIELDLEGIRAFDSPIVGILVVGKDREPGLLHRDRFRSGHQLVSNRRPSWAMCSSSMATSPVLAFSVGPFTLSGRPRSKLHVALSCLPDGSHTVMRPSQRGTGVMPNTVELSQSHRMPSGEPSSRTNIPRFNTIGCSFTRPTRRTTP